MGCKSCTFWRDPIWQAKDAPRHCKRHAPVYRETGMAVDPETKQPVNNDWMLSRQWPVTAPDDACGDYEPRP